MEVADTIEEVKTTCHFCNKKAVFNLKHVNGLADCTGPAVQLGAEEKYVRRALPNANANDHWGYVYSYLNLG